MIKIYQQETDIVTLFAYFFFISFKPLKLETAFFKTKRII